MTLHQSGIYTERKSERMRILHVGLSCLGGGIETCVINYFRAISGSGIVFDFADIYGDGIAYENEIRTLGGEIYPVGNYKTDPIGVFRGLVNLLNKGEHAAVHVHMLSAANLVPALAAQKSGTPLVIHSHNTNCSGAVRKMMNFLGSGILRRIPAVRLACSEAAKEWMWKTAEAEVLPNAMDLDRFAFSGEARAAIRSELGIREETLVLGFLGRLEQAKNVLWLADVLHGVKQQIPDVKLVIVGTGSEEPELRNKVRQMDLEADVIFAGFRKNTAAWYSAMDVFLMPSFYEGLPLSGIEAQISGLPCLFSTAITRELKQTEKVCFLDIEKQNLQEWIDLAVQAADERDDRTLPAAMKDSAFNMEHAAVRLIEVYRRCGQGS